MVTAVLLLLYYNHLWGGLFPKKLLPGEDGAVLISSITRVCYCETMSVRVKDTRPARKVVLIKF